MKAIVVVLGFVLLTAGCSGSAGGLSSGKIIKEIDAGGAANVVHSIFKDQAKWEDLLASVSTGKKEWLDVAVKIRPGTDASYAEGLVIAVANALPVSPENVLPLVESGFDLKDICGFPFIEPDRERLMRHYRAAKEALKKPISSRLDQLKEKCIAELDMQFAAISSK